MLGLARSYSGTWLRRSLLKQQADSKSSKVAALRSSLLEQAGWLEVFDDRCRAGRLARSITQSLTLKITTAQTFDQRKCK